MVNPKRFYTYAYLREDGTPYYIGKGSNNRIYKNDGRTCNKPRDKTRIIFLKQNLTEDEAFKHEIYMIAILGRKDLGTGILRNKSEGGQGNSGRIVSEETKEKLRTLNLGKKYSEETKEKLRTIKSGENHPLYGKKHSDETKKIQSKVKLGKNNPFYGKKHSKEWKDMIVNISCKYDYTITNPLGEIFVTKNLAKFCRDNNLHNGAMCLVSDGKRKHHKNWKVAKSIKEKDGE